MSQRPFACWLRLRSVPPAYTGDMTQWFRAAARHFAAGVIGAALVLVSSGGCGFGARCTVQSRAAQYEADAAAARVFLELSQTRGAENAAWILWHVRVAPPAATATSVVLREGPPGLPGRLLYEFPLVNPVPPAGVVTQVFVRTAYSGVVPFDELWALLQSQPVSFEIVFDGGARPLRLGPLRPTGSSDWQDACS